MAYVYILKSVRNGNFYVGSTVDLDTRLKQHKSGFTPTTKRFGEIELVFSQQYPALVDARSIERRLKKLKRKDFIEKILKDGYIRMVP